MHISVGDGGVTHIIEGKAGPITHHRAKVTGRHAAGGFAALHDDGLQVPAVRARGQETDIVRAAVAQHRHWLQPLHRPMTPARLDPQPEDQPARGLYERGSHRGCDLDRRERAGEE